MLNTFFGFLIAFFGLFVVFLFLILFFSFFGSSSSLVPHGAFFKTKRGETKSELAFFVAFLGSSFF